MAGQPTTKFRYSTGHDGHDRAPVRGRPAARHLLRGTIAWFMWLGLHLFYLLGGRNRVSAVVNLAWRH
jgi:NADH dehydrogenase FAD-containing subunit